MTDPADTTPPRVPFAIGPTSLQPFFADSVTEDGVLSEPSEARGLLWVDSSDPDGIAAMLSDYPQIEWVQLPFAGVERFLRVIDRERIWTGAQGAYGDAVAEHALALMLGGLRNLHGFARATTWGANAGSNLIGAKVVIVGAGGITASLLSLLAPFGCDVTVVRRSDAPMEGASRTVAFSELDSTLGDADVVVLALPLTPETTGLFNAERLALLAEHAWIVNVARGGHIVTDDLVAALSERRIGGAALDVTDPEPLPDGHPLWSLDNCIITPHSANTMAMAAPRLTQRMADNLARFRHGQPLLGMVDLDAGY